MYYGEVVDLGVQSFEKVRERNTFHMGGGAL